MPDNVRDTFDQLDRYIAADLNVLLKSKNGGPNYAAALLIAIACEALSRMLDKSSDFYLTEILAKHGLRRELAEDVANAMRNGIAHAYDTRYIQAGSLRIELIISWSAMQHLSVRNDLPGLVLNVHTMATDLSELFDKLRQTLPPGGALPKKWTAESITGVDGRHIPIWREWLSRG